MRYDTTLKTLFQAPPQQLLRLLVGGQAREMLTVEYPTVRMRRPDLVVRLTDDRLYHLELQSDHDRRPDRCAGRPAHPGRAEKCPTSCA